MIVRLKEVQGGSPSMIYHPNSAFGILDRYPSITISQLDSRGWLVTEKGDKKKEEEIFLLDFPRPPSTKRR